MMGDGFSLQNSNKESPKKTNCNNNSCNKKKKKKKKRGGAKKKMTFEQSMAYKSVSEWVFLDQSSLNSAATPAVSTTAAAVDDNFGVQWTRPKEKLVFELHSHSICSDGFLSPSKVVERAHQNGVKVLALTDHDTLFGIPEAVEAALKFGIKIIPGVEISTVFSPRSGPEEPVHILAYYSSCGPTKFEELEKFLCNIRDGRFLRARNMVLKLNKLKLPIKWEHVARIAGKGVAPGRLHVARALLEGGHVESLKQAFSRYLYDDGPAYSKGNEPFTEETIQLIHETGGVAVLAHPWALKNPVAIVRRLKEAGLNGIEVYRGDGKLGVYSDLADAYSLLKLGGSDFHGRIGQTESNLGSVSLPVLDVHEFLKLARPIWCKAIRDVLEDFANDPSDSNLKLITRFVSSRVSKCASTSDHAHDLINQCLSLWLTKEERQNAEIETIKLKLSHVSINKGENQVPLTSKQS